MTQLTINSNFGDADANGNHAGPRVVGTEVHNSMQTMHISRLMV
jgi:hypothetical protein